MKERITQRAKALITSLMAIMIVFSIATPALAATKPSIRYTESTRTRPSYYCRYGRNITWDFYVRSGSYTYRYGYRSRVDIDIYKKSNKKWITGWYKYYTGNGYYRLYTPLTRSYGFVNNAWYYMRYRTNYRKSAYTSRWYVTSARYIDFKTRS